MTFGSRWPFGADRPGHRLTARAIIDRGAKAVTEKLRDHAEAERIAREAIAILRSSRRTGTTRAILGQACYVLGILIMNRDNGSKEAYQFLVESVEIRREVHGPDDMRIGAFLNMMAHCCTLQGRDEEALARSEQALTLARLHPGEQVDWKAECEARFQKLRDRSRGRDRLVFESRDRSTRSRLRDRTACGIVVLEWVNPVVGRPR